MPSPWGRLVARPRHRTLLQVLSVSFFLPLLPAAEVPLDASRFLGSASCASASCHGGADPSNNQYLIWKTRDFHTRSESTLALRRSEMLVEFLQLPPASQSVQCTVCHAPFQHLPATRRASDLPPQEAVSCESCHGPAEAWIRSHTRADWSHQDRVAAGLRDLRHLYVRANHCVGCHQNLSSSLLKAGHPELIFELDGQSASQPRHWREPDPARGPQAWLTGQAVALRELSAQLTRESSPAESLWPRWSAMASLLLKSNPPDHPFPSSLPLLPRPDHEQLRQIMTWSDGLAQHTASSAWPPQRTRSLLGILAAPSVQTGEPDPPLIYQARQAELIALGLDRLLVSLRKIFPDEPGLQEASRALDRIFAEVQSLPDFNPDTYARRLADFARALETSP